MPTERRKKRAFKPACIGLALGLCLAGGSVAGAGSYSGTVNNIIPDVVNSGGQDGLSSANNNLTNVLEEPGQAAFTSASHTLEPGFSNLAAWPETILSLSASTGAAGGSLVLKWTAPKADGSTGTAAAYAVRYSTVQAGDPALSEAQFLLAPSVTDFITVPSPGFFGATEQLTLTGLEGGTTYYFAVKARAAWDGWSYLSNGAAVSARSYATAFAGFSDVGANAIQFNWTAAGNGPRALYRVLVSTAADPQNPGGAVVTSSDTYNLYLSSSGLNPNTTYYFRVAGLNNNSVTTSYTAPQSTSTLLAYAPAFTGFTNVGVSAMQFNWSDNNPAGTLHRVLVSTAADPANPDGAVVTSSDTYGVSLTTSGLDGNTTYYFSVAGLNNNGVPSAYTAAQGTSTLANAPVFTSFSGVADDTIRVNWATANNAYPDTDYNVLVSTASDPLNPAGAPVIVNDTPESYLTLSGLASQTTYYFTLAAVNNNGVSTAYSDAQSTVTLTAIATRLYFQNAVAPVDANSRYLTVPAGSSVVTYTKNTIAGTFTPPTTQTQFTAVAAGSTVAWYSPPLDAATIAGNVTFNIWAKESATGANATITAELLRADNAGNILSVISAVVQGRTELTTTLKAQNWVQAPVATTLNNGDRLAARWYIDDSGGTMTASGRTVTATIGGASAGVSGDSWVQVTESLAPARPAVSAITAVAARQITAGWQLVEGATGYTLAAAYGPENPPSSIYADTTTTGGLSATLDTPALNPDTTYYLFVRTNGPGNSSSWAAYPGTATLLAYPPASSAFTDAGPGYITLNWSANGNADDTTRYRVAVSTAPNPLNPDGAAVTTEDTYGLSLTSAGLAANTTYYFSVAGINKNNVPTAYTTAIGTSTLLAYAPAYSGFSNVYTSSVQFNWTDGNPAGTQHRVFVSTASDPFNPAGAVVTSSDTYNVSLTSAGLNANTTYYFSVADINNNGVATAYTAAQGASTLANAPVFSGFTNVAAASAQFNWTSANPTGTLYRVYSSTAQDPLAPGGAAAASSDTYNSYLSSAGLAANTTYYFRVAALNNSGLATGYTVQQGTSTLLAYIPVLSNFTNISANSGQFNWTSANPAGTLYRVYASTAANPLSPAGAVVTSSNTYNLYLSSAGLNANTTYYFSVAGINNNGVATGYSTAAGTSTLLAYAPAFANFTNVAADSVKFNWTDSNPAGTLYRVYTSTVSNPLSPGGAAATSSDTYNAYLSSSGLNANTTYYFRVAGLNNNGVASAYTAAQATSSLAGQPSGLYFTGITPDTMQLNWDPSGNGAGTLYRVLVSTAADPQNPGTGQVVTSSYTYNVYLSSTGLNSYTDYYFKVAAINNNGVITGYTALTSKTLSFGQLGAPAAGSIINIYSSSITASWSLVSGATGYTLAASLSPDDPPTAVFASSTTVGNGLVTASVFSPALSPDTVHYLFVRANGPGAVSAWFAYPPAATLLAYAPLFTAFTGTGYNSAQFNWSANGNANPGTLYRVYTSTAQNPLSPGGAVTTSSDTYNIYLSSSGLDANTTYYFRVAGVNKDGTDTAYTVAQATTTWIHAPTASGFTSVSAGSVQFNWSANGNPYPRTLYRVYASTAQDPLSAGGAVVTASDTYSVSLASANLAADTTYYFRVAGLGNDDTVTAYTLAAGTATLLANAPVPAAFTNVAANSVQFNWSPNGNANPGTLYRVYASTAQDPLSPGGAVVTSSDTYNIYLGSAGLNLNTMYYFRVAGLNRDNVATAYTAASGTATLANIPLSAVSTFSALSEAGFTAAWDANGNPRGTLYIVQASTAQNFNAGASNQVTAATAPADGTSYAFTGLTFSTAYYFQARAVNQNGVYTNYAALGSTRTLALQPPAPDPVTQVSANSITASWELESQATGYTLAASVNPGTAPSPVYAYSTTAGLSAVLDTPALNPNTTYYLFVRSNGPGESGAWAAYPATSTLANPPLSAVSTFSAVTFNSFAVSWDNNSNPLGLTLYEVEVSTAPDFNSGAAGVSFTTVPAAGPGATFSGLPTDTYYYFHVRAAHNRGGFTSWVNFGAQKTLALPTVHYAGDGVILYGNGSGLQFRNYISTTNSFGLAGAPVSGANGTLYVIKTNPLSSKQEAVAGYVKNGTLHVFCTDGTNWSEEWTQYVGGTEATRRFDIAYETNSGDAMVLYSQGQSGANELGYRTKSGSADCGPGGWSAHADLTPAQTSGVAQWVKMASDRRTGYNDLAAIWADDSGSLSAMVWNGAAWENEHSPALETSLGHVSVAQDVEDFGVEYESLSGNIMVVWDNSAGNSTTNGVRYATAAFTGASPLHTWGKVVTPPTFGYDAINLDLAANPASNEMVFASLGISGVGLQAGYWSGTAWSDKAAVDTSAAVPVAGSKMVAAGWVSSGTYSRSVIAYDDGGTVTNIGWVVGSGGTTFTKQTDAVVTPAFASPQRYYQIQQDPVNLDRLIFTVADAASDLFAKRAVLSSTAGFAWHDANGGVTPLETNLSTPTVGGYSFVFWPAPPVTTFAQSAYRFFANTDTTDVGAPLAAQDTLSVLSSSGTAFRLRTLVHIGQVDLPVNGQGFKLQFAGRGDGTCDAPDGGNPADYTDVTSATLIAFKDNSPANGAPLTANANDPQEGALTTIAQTYVEQNNSTNSVAGISRNQDGMWDFALKDNGMAAGTSYCFRLAKGDGSALNAYGVYPEVMLPTAVYLNEVYPSGLAAGDDWVELYNNTASTPSLVGWKVDYVENTIVLGGTGINIWTGHAGDVINAYSTFTIVNISTNMVGGQSYNVRLLNGVGGVVDQVQWPILSAGQSFARVTDGNPSFFEVDPTPTPGYANAVSTDALEINEVSYGAPDRQFIEIYNTSSAARTLRGYTLRNAASSANGLAFRFTRKIYPNSYTVIDFSSLSDDGKSFTDVFGPQGLSAAGDFLALENPSGSVVNAVTWQSDAHYTRYDYTAAKVSAGNFAPANAVYSIGRQPSEGSDTGSNSTDFTATSTTTLASRNNNAGTATHNTLLYPANTSAPQVLSRKFPVTLNLGAASGSGAANNIVFERTGGSSDPGSPHIYRLQDIGFNLNTYGTAQTAVQVGLTFYDQDGAPLVSSAVYRATFNSDTGAASAPQIILGTVTYDGSVHAVYGSTVAPLWFNDASRAGFIKLGVSNNSPAGFNSLQLSTVSFQLLGSDLASPLSQLSARSLFSAVMLVKELAGGTAGVYEPAIDISTISYAPTASIFVDDVTGVSTLTVPSAYLSAASIPAASTATFYIVLESLPAADSASPDVFSLRLGTVTVLDGAGGQPQNTAQSALAQTSSVTLISPAQAPAGTSWPRSLPSAAVMQAPAAYYTNSGDTAVSSSVYAAATDGYLRAWEKDGTVKWSYPTNPLSPIRTSPIAVVESGNLYVYFGDDNGDVYKVQDLGAGYHTEWQQSLGLPVKSNITCTDIDCTGPNLYFGAGNTVQCLNKADGSACANWNYASAVNAPISGTISIDDRATIKTGWIGLENGKVVALQTADSASPGASPAEYVTGGAITSSPYLDARVEDPNNVLYFTSGDGTLYGRVSSNLVTLPTGWTDYHTAANAAIKTSPTVTFYGTKYIFFGDDAGRLHKVDASGNSAPGWPFQAGGAIRSSPVWVPDSPDIPQGGHNYVYFGCDDGYIYAVDADSGARRTGWPVATGGPVRSDIVIDPDNATLIVGSNDGKTYVLKIGQ